MRESAELSGPPTKVCTRLAYSSFAGTHVLVFWADLDERGETQQRLRPEALKAAHLLARAKSAKRLVQAAEEIGPLFDDASRWLAASHLPGVSGGMADLLYGTNPLASLRSLGVPDREALEREFGHAWGDRLEDFGFSPDGDLPRIRCMLKSCEDRVRFLRIEPLLDWVIARSVLCLALRASYAVSTGHVRRPSDETAWPEAIEGSNFELERNFASKKVGFGADGEPRCEATRANLIIGARQAWLYGAFLRSRLSQEHVALHRETGLIPIVSRGSKKFRADGQICIEFEGRSGRERLNALARGLSALHAIGCDRVLVRDSNERVWTRLVSDGALSAIYAALGRMLLKSPDRVGMCARPKCGCPFVKYATRKQMYCSDACRVTHSKERSGKR